MANARICDKCGSVAKNGTPDYDEMQVFSLSRIDRPANGLVYDICSVCAGDLKRWFDGDSVLRPKG